MLRRLRRFARAVALPAGLAAFFAPHGALGAGTVHLRGVVLGTIGTFLDVGLADRRDVRVSMPLEPLVDIAEPASASALRVGTDACVAVAGLRARGVLVEPAGLRIVADGRRNWDRAGAPTLIAGRVVRRVVRGATIVVTIAAGSARSEIAVPPDATVAALREGSRAALVAGHSALVIARVPDDDVLDAAERIIVGDGTLIVPI